MSAVSDELVRSVLRYYASMAGGPAGSADLIAARPGDLATLGLSVGMSSTADRTHTFHRSQIGPRPWATLQRLSKLDALHSDEQLLRHGWVTLVGTIDVDGTPTRVRLPAASRSVRLRPRSTAGRVAAQLSDLMEPDDLLMTPLGEFELTALVEDREARTGLTVDIEFGRGGLTTTVSERYLRKFPALTGWIRSVGRAAGFPNLRVLPPTERVEDWIDRPGVVAIVEHSLFMVREVSTPSVRNSLLNWSTREGIERTALATMLDRACAPDPIGADARSDDPAELDHHDPIESPFVLSPSQASVVRRARDEDLVVVSGAPGSGKTHTLCAVALDAIAGGRSVLVATQSRHAADVVTELLRRTPGPEPVTFGNGVGMAALLDELSDRQVHPLPAEHIRTLDAELELCRATVDGLRSSIADGLRLESDAATASRWQDALPALIDTCPGVFDPDSDLDAIADLLTVCAPVTPVRRRAPGLLTRWRERRTRRLLHALTGAEPSVPLERIALAVQAARAGRAAAQLGARGGPAHRRPLAAAGDRGARTADRARAAPACTAVRTLLPRRTGPRRWASSAPRCARDAVCDASCWRRWTHAGSRLRPRSGSARSPRSRTCCPPPPACSTW